MVHKSPVTGHKPDGKNYLVCEPDLMFVTRLYHSILLLIMICPDIFEYVSYVSNQCNDEIAKNVLNLLRVWVNGTYTTKEKVDFRTMFLYTPSFIPSCLVAICGYCPFYTKDSKAEFTG